MKQQLPLYLM